MFLATDQKGLLERISALSQGSAPGEMTFPCALAQEEAGFMYLDSVLDTGCGSAYLVGGPCGFQVTPVCFRVELADGSVVQVTEQVDVSFTVGDRTEDVKLKVLASAAARDPYVLFGRELISKFRVQTDGCRVTMDGQVLHEAANFLAELVNDKTIDKGEMAELPQVEEKGSQSVFLPIDERVSQTVENAIQQILGERKELDFCAGATMVLRRLRPSEDRDTPNQEYTFELTLPPAVMPVSSTAANRLYSAAVYRKLSPSEKEEFDELVDGYTSRGWWKEADYRTCAEQCGYAANVFPVLAKGRKTRLVSDFRSLNRFYPSSTITPLIHHPLMLLRCLAGDIVVADCRSAFYRVRLAKPVWLNVGGRNFLCWRLAFGLSMGPEGLRSSLGCLWTLWKEHLAEGPGYAALFVDDFFLTQRRDLASLLYVLQRCGFEVPVEKFQDNKAETRLLGMTLRRQDGRMVVHCDELGIGELVKQVRSNLTKKEIFALSGRVGYDPCHVHAERRLIADLLRSVVGMYPTPWAQRLELKPDDQKLVDELLNWLIETDQGPCTHATVPGEKVYLRLETDASKFGMGIVIRQRSTPGSEWSVLYTDAVAWKRVQRNYHVNRLESYALLLGMRITTMFVDFMKNATLGGGETAVEVEVLSDSTTALAWARTGEPQVNYKSIEMRQIRALAESLHLEWKTLRNRVTKFTGSHISGEDNVDGDRLSRLLYRPMGEQSLGDRVHIPKPPRKAGDAIKQVAAGTESLVEWIASESRDLETFIWKLQRWSGALLSWGGRDVAGLGRLVGDSSVNFDCFNAQVIHKVGKCTQAIAPVRRGQEYIDIDGVHYLEQTLFNGEMVRRVVIPNHPQLERVRELVVRYYHERDGHRGKRFDVANLTCSVFHLEGVHRAVQAVIAKCWTCARKNAIARKTQVTPVQTIPRLVTLPPFSRVAIDFVHFRTTTVLSALCIDTGVLFLTVVPRPSAEGAMYGLRRLSNLYCVQLKRILSDNAKALSHAFEIEARKAWNSVEIVRRAAYESAQNPVERSHRDMWSILRSRKSSKCLSEDVSEVTDNILEEVASIINRRPLGVHGDTVVTPARLAWGANYVEEGSQKLVNFRRFFYENLFAVHRRRHLPTRKLRRALVSVGEFVLYQYSNRQAKDEFEHLIGRIVDIEGNILTVQSRGKVVRVGSSSVIPLGKYFQVDGLSPPGGHEEEQKNSAALEK